MKYPDGREILVGDRVSMENGRAEGIVEAVLDSSTALESWGLAGDDENHVMFKQDRFGLICIGERGIEWDEIKLISRAAGTGARE